MDGLLEILYFIVNILLIASLAATINELNRKYKEKQAAKKQEKELNNHKDKKEE